MAKKNSEFGKLAKIDFWKGLIVAILSAISVTFINITGQASDFQSINWQLISLSAAGAFVGYLVKNFITNSEGDILKKES